MCERNRSDLTVLDCATFLFRLVRVRVTVALETHVNEAGRVRGRVRVYVQVFSSLFLQND